MTWIGTAESSATIGVAYAFNALLIGAYTVATIIVFSALHTFKIVVAHAIGAVAVKIALPDVDADAPAVAIAFLRLTHEAFDRGVLAGRAFGDIAGLGVVLSIAVAFVVDATELRAARDPLTCALIAPRGFTGAGEGAAIGAAVDIVDAIDGEAVVVGADLVILTVVVVSAIDA